LTTPNAVAEEDATVGRTGFGCKRRAGWEPEENLFLKLKMRRQTRSYKTSDFDFPLFSSKKKKNTLARIHLGLGTRPAPGRP